MSIAMLEDTKFNPDWYLSIWSISNRQIHYKYENFQYKLKTRSLFTLSERNHHNINNKTTPKINSLCFNM